MTTGVDAHLDSAVSPLKNAPASRFGDRFIVTHLCLLAAIRVFVFAAAFPPINNIDEQLHFDLVCRYSHGDLPKSIVTLGPEASALITVYETPEYHYAPSDFPNGQISPPLWQRPQDEQQRIYNRNEPIWEQQIQFEAMEPPLYYTIAGGWHNIGKVLGVRGGELIYWVRFLNVPIYAFWVWLSYLLAKAVFPSSRFVYLGVPFLIALLPQDAFYGITNDVLSAPLATLTFIFLLRLLRKENRNIGLAIATGIGAAGCCLTKLTNAPVVLIVAAACFYLLWKSIRVGAFRRQWSVPITMLLCAVLPVMALMLRYYIVSGDPTGTAGKSYVLTWTAKPFNEYWNNPIFTPTGFADFGAELIKTLWRGEFTWYKTPLTSPAADWFYVAISTIFLLCALGRSGEAGAILCWIMLLLSFVLIVYLSIRFDFGRCTYPSRQRPYFTSGRLVFAALVPFMILLVRGIEQATKWRRLQVLQWPLLGIIAAVMTISEIAISWDVFASQYNWFHLP